MLPPIHEERTPVDPPHCQIIWNRPLAHRLLILACDYRWECITALLLWMLLHTGLGATPAQMSIDLQLSRKALQQGEFSIAEKLLAKTATQGTLHEASRTLWGEILLGKALAALANQDWQIACSAHAKLKRLSTQHRGVALLNKRLTLEGQRRFLQAYLLEGIDPEQSVQLFTEAANIFKNCTTLGAVSTWLARVRRRQARLSLL